MNNPKNEGVCRHCGGPLPPYTEDEVRDLIEGRMKPRQFCKPTHKTAEKKRRRKTGRILTPVPGCKTPGKWTWSNPLLAQVFADGVSKNVYRCSRGDRLHYHTTSDEGPYPRYDKPIDALHDRLEWERARGSLAKGA